MGLKGKLIASMEVKCGGHLINDLMHTNTHQAANISPTINHFEVHEGEIGKVGTIINMKYKEDGQEKTMKYEIEALDRYKKSITRKVIGGDLLDFYSSFTLNKVGLSRSLLGRKQGKNLVFITANMNIEPSGFNNALVTRALVIACTIFTIIFGVRGRGNQLGWSYQVVLLSGFLLVLVLFWWG
ncbi:hypothetical protein MTR67_001263 [Solanum verrucosum]|uniref:Bet v I/Major latex protein domain-containing protein n=1 Tax=Solanum verrucosum TaxID=315347 RepID=A0AAF0PN84_SOLVR|nr:hypothetical protein MTR67_001263 [Solanum verrucosum]